MLGHVVEPWWSSSSTAVRTREALGDSPLATRVTVLRQTRREPAWELGDELLVTRPTKRSMRVAQPMMAGAPGTGCMTAYFPGLPASVVGGGAGGGAGGGGTFG